MIYKKDLELEKRWVKLKYEVERLGNKKPRDLNTILFLIGVQELGKGRRSFSKEEKQDLIHIAICKVLSYSGYYELQGIDEQGWPHWKLVRKLPHFDLLDQEKLLKMHVIEYFEREINIEV